MVQPLRLLSVHFELLSVLLFTYMLRMQMWKIWLRNISVFFIDVYQGTISRAKGSLDHNSPLLIHNAKLLKKMHIKLLLYWLKGWLRRRVKACPRPASFLKLQAFVEPPFLDITLTRSAVGARRSFMAVARETKTISGIWKTAWGNVQVRLMCISCVVIIPRVSYIYIENNPPISSSYNVHRLHHSAQIIPGCHHFAIRSKRVLLITRGICWEIFIQWSLELRGWSRYALKFNVKWSLILTFWGAPTMSSQLKQVYCI